MVALVVWFYECKIFVVLCNVFSEQNESFYSLKLLQLSQRFQSLYLDHRKLGLKIPFRTFILFVHKKAVITLFYKFNYLGVNFFQIPCKILKKVINIHEFIALDIGNSKIQKTVHLDIENLQLWKLCSFRIKYQISKVLHKYWGALYIQHIPVHHIKIRKAQI